MPAPNRLRSLPQLLAGCIDRRRKVAFVETRAIQADQRLADRLLR